MASGKITKDEIIESGVVTEITALATALNAAVKSMSAFTEASIKFKQNTNPDNLRELATAQKGLNDLTTKGTTAATAATTASDKLRQKTKELNEEEERAKIAYQDKRKALRDTIKAENESKKATENLTKVLKQEIKTEKQATEQNKKLRAIRKQLDVTTKKGAKSITDINRVLDRNNQLVQKNASALGKQKMNIGNYKSALKGLSSSLGLVTGGFALAAMAIRKTITVIKGAIKVNRSFEKSFANVLTLLDKTQKKEFKIELKKGSLNVMAKYGLAIEDVNGALFDVISNGIEAGDAIEFLDKSARLAVAGNAELSSVVKGATKVYEVYKDEVDDVDEVLNAFFAAQVKGATTVEALASNIGKVASTAHKAGIPINELFGTFAGLTKFLDGTEESSTALVNIINALIKTTPQVEKKFKEFGIETGITAIKQNGLLKTILQVVDATKDNEDAIVKLIPNIRAFKGFAGLTAESIAELEKNILELNDTELSAALVQEAYNEQMATADKQATTMKGSYERMLIVIGGGESIFKKIGTAIRSELKEKFDEVSMQLEILSTVWTREVTIIQLAWQRLKRELTNEEVKIALEKNEEAAAKSLKSIAERYYGLTLASKTATKAEKEAAAVAKEAAEALALEDEKNKLKIKTITTLNNDIAELRKEKLALNVTDEASIEIKNKEIKAIQEQIKALNELGIKEEEIVTIKATKNENILDLIDKQNKAEAEKLTEKLDNENEITEDSLEELAAMRLAEIKRGQEADKKKKENFKYWMVYSLSEAQNLSNSIVGLLNTQIDAQEKADIEKAKSRGASEAEISKIEKKAAKERKNVALADSIIYTALAITKALFTANDWIEGIIAGVLIAAEGAIQIAAIEAASFEKGTEDSGNKWLNATVSEKGTERVNLADGSSFLTPNKQTKMLLPPHSEVIPNIELQRELAELQGSSKNKTQTQNNREDYKELIKVMKNKPDFTLNVTEGGFSLIAKKGNSFSKYLDRKYRGKV